MASFGKAAAVGAFGLAVALVIMGSGVSGGGGGGGMGKGSPFTANQVVMANSTATQLVTSPGTQLPSAYLCAQFGAASTYITSPLNFAPGTADFTIKFWIKPFGSADTYNLLSRIDNTAPDCATGGCGRVAIGSNLKISTGAYPAVWPVDVESAAVTTKQWTHVVVTRNSTNLTIYLNGSSSATSPGNTTVYTFSRAGGGLDIGGNIADGIWYVGGLAELALFNVGWNSTQVTADYNSGLGTYGTGSETGLQAGYHLNGDATDFKAGANNGVWTGTAQYGLGAIGPRTYIPFWPPQTITNTAYCGSLTGAVGCQEQWVGGKSRWVPMF